MIRDRGVSRATSAFLRAGAAATLGIALVLGSSQIAFADTECTGDSCDGSVWQAARGISNEISYWGMTAGHNCTNYVAWKLIGDGEPRPATGPGNAADWASNARADGYLVNSIPQVGSVAQWDAFADGNPLEGHLAYVEKVNGDGTILISEDYWTEDGSGQLTFRTIAAASVSNFIHYQDISQFLRRVTVGATSCQEASAGVRVTPTALTTVNMGEAAPRVFYVDQGKIFQARSGADGWGVTDTTITTSGSTIAAVKMGLSSVFLMSVENGTLYMNVETASGWQKMPTGLENVTGDISAVNAGGLWPTVMLSQDGMLYEMWGDMDGWHAQSTGLLLPGAISAVVAGGNLEVYGTDTGQIKRTWRDATGWHDEATGVMLTGALTAASVGGAVQLFVLQDDAIVQVSRSESGWLSTPIGVAAGTVVSAVDLGGATPVIIQAG